jgi:hypothetical protein
MKGLLYKDFVAILCSYKKNVLLVFAVYILLGFGMKMPLMLCMLAFFTGIYALSCLTFDETAHFDAYARTLPITPGQIVAARYLAGLICMGAGVVVSGVLLAVYPLIFAAEEGYALQSAASCLAALSTTLLYYAIAYPLSFQVGAAKSRSYVMIVMALLFCGIAFVARHLPNTAQTANPFDFLTAENLIPVMACIAAACFVLFVASGILSAQIYRRKEY